MPRAACAYTQPDRITKLTSSCSFTNMKYVLVAMPQVLWFLLTPALLLSQPVPTLAAAPVSDMVPSPMPAPPSGCPSTSTCGNVDIQYPFGISDNCSRGFRLTCNYSFNPPRPYLGNIEVINMTLETGEMRVRTPVSYTCYNSSNTIESRGVVGGQFDLTNSPFQISPKKNEFTAIGCNTLAFLQSSNYLGVCITMCVSLDEAAADGKPCTGLGCCQSTISNLSTITVDLSNLVRNDTLLPAWKYSPCSHAFVAEKGWYNFSRKDLNGTGNESYANWVGERSIPLVLDWAIMSGTCPLSSANPPAPACLSNHSNCTNAAERPGYLCNCQEGYSGNPYVTGGCTNINECEKQNHCQSGSTCRDTPGGYECKCKFGQKGDGKSAEGCRPILPATAVAIVATLCAIILLGVLLSFIRREHKRRKQRGFFDKNGGEILKRMNINIFTQTQLDKITDHYNTPIGEGAFGKVFLGTIIDGNQRVAVKRSFAKGEERLGQGDFVNEITFQFGISHTNLVRLIRCCLETDVPMLVFEFIPNGSLHNVLHAAKKHILSLPERLDIAIGSAEALTYMHSHASQKILHGDVKSGNILLDENFKPKVSDFGSSKHELITRYNKWSVMGDMNYIDPAYIKTGDFTEKSDVYSFGIVLLELITQKKPKYDGSNSLSMNFVKSYKDESTRREMYDQEILSPAQPYYMECLDRFSEIAVQCLKEDVDDRPTMAQVVEQLKLVKLRAREAEIMG